jgi:hypothetical protein
VRSGFLLIGGVVLGACRPCEKPPPELDEADVEALAIVRGRFVDSDTVELAFSRPLAPPTDVDPGKFRLSIAVGEADEYRGRCSTYSYYCELADGISDLGCGGCYVGGLYEEPCPAPITVTSLALDETDPHLLVLELSAPIRKLVCQQIAYADGDAFVQAHFSKLDIPTITDVDGNALDDIAPRWVLEEEREEYHEKLFPLRDALVPIPCPEDFG